MSDNTHHAGRRREAADETRRRIVEATFALHGEQGIAATTMRHIAKRARVSIGAVYHHFPTYEDAIIACGAHADETVPAPSGAIFEGARTTVERAEILVAALFDWFERLPVLERLRCDQDRIPVLRDFVRAERENRLALAQDALRDEADKEARALVVASLLDIAVYRNLRQGGLDRDGAVRAVCAILGPWLTGSQNALHVKHREL
jgi:AcrR family transcriptional regulator